ncbi:MAG: HAD-IIB family hydrolase [Candidatus Acidiferrales bacterium]
MLPARHLIFTDLDGTLLDNQTYSWAAAEEALEEIERRRVPLVFVTSKTRAELEVLRRKLGHGHPFVTENGGGIFIPQGYFNLPLEGARRAGRYQCVALARPYKEIVSALEELAAEAGVTVVGFHQMSAREIAQNTGLSLQEAELARQREFDEPFFFAGAGEEDIHKFGQAARRRRFEFVQGGRFWHLAAGSDKGRAVRHLVKLYRTARRSRLRSVGLGDSPNDLSLLAAVDQAVLLPQPDGTFASDVLSRLPHVLRGAAAGPAGWNQAVLQILDTT